MHNTHSHGMYAPAMVPDKSSSVENDPAEQLSHGLFNRLQMRSDSMDLQNDPRFFQPNVIDKRLSALASLVVVCTLVLGTAMSMLFGLKKDMHFDGSGWCTFVGAAHMIGFFGQVLVSLCCMLAVYTICQQLYHIYRLMTSGPTGIEIAGMYYLTDSVVLWRHCAVQFLLNGLVAFVISSGLILFVKLVKDGGSLKQCFGEVTQHERELAFDFHLAFAIITLLTYVCLTIVMCHIRGVHKKHFQACYKLTTSTKEMTEKFRSMGHHAGVGFAGPVSA